MIIDIGKNDLDDKWTIEDLIELQGRLTDEEFKERLATIQSDSERLKVSANLLNDREALPERYKELVLKYKGNKKVDKIEPILFSKNIPN